MAVLCQIKTKYQNILYMHPLLLLTTLKQVGYTSTVLAPHCLAADGRCGTYLYESSN